MTARTLLAGGCVLALSPRTPNLTRGDLLIEDGVVAEVGTGLRARDAERIDATDAIVMPGFVDTHRHVWRSLLRNDGDRAEPAADAATADDVYAATLVGLLGAAEAGITTVVDWAPPARDHGVLEAALRAHADAGLRTVFVVETLDTIARIADAAGPLTTLAFGTDPNADTDGWAAARAQGRRVYAHGTSGRGGVAALGRQGLLGEDVTLVHCADLDDADLDAVASSKAALSLAATSEMANGLGAPPIQHLIDRDIRPGLGVDDDRLTPGDMFAQMRAVISLQHATVFDLKLSGKGGVPKLMNTRDAIRFSTVDGARAVGLADITGSLEPGRQADVIVLRTDRPNVFPVNDPIGAVVWGMDTSNVDHVFVAGRPLMRGGALVADVPRARELATAARARFAGPANDRPVGAAEGRS